jgi:hypothetical protein
MALRTLVEVPAGLRNSFTAVPAARRMSLCPTWDESWPEWAKKNPRVPEPVFGLDWGNLQHFTKEMMKEIKGLPNPELAVQHLVRKIGEYFALLEPVELNLAELSMQLRANMSDDGGFKPGFDSMAHIGRIQAQGGAKKEYETRVWQLYFIAVELDKDSSIGRTEDRVDILEAEMAVMQERVAGKHPPSGPSVDVLTQPNSEFNAKRTTEPSRGPLRRPPAFTWAPSAPTGPVVQW